MWGASLKYQRSRSALAGVTDFSGAHIIRIGGEVSSHRTDRALADQQVEPIASLKGFQSCAGFGND
jgi:hypothetical protein